jgi:hypothetical protein
VPEFVQEHREEKQAVGAPQVLGLHRDAKVCEHPSGDRDHREQHGRHHRMEGQRRQRTLTDWR